MERQSMIIKETNLVCLELVTLLLNITLAQRRLSTWEKFVVLCNCGIACETNYHQPNKNQLPPAVVAKIQVLVDHLHGKKLLASCGESKTQDVKESDYLVVWNLVPKEQINPPWLIKLAVEIAKLIFNSGMKAIYYSIFSDPGVIVSEYMLLEWDEMDNK